MELVVQGFGFKMATWISMPSSLLSFSSPLDQYRQELLIQATGTHHQAEATLIDR
jgi:hypothetical protein